MFGFCFLNKPAGASSNSLIYKLRKLTGVRKIGHSGTLDPFAQGLLIAAIGEATKYLPYIKHDEKEYTAKLKLGIATDTLDLDGEVIAQSPVPNLHIDFIKQQVQNLTLLKEQVVPAFSAKRVNGKRLYDMARKGDSTPELKQNITVHAASLIDFQKDMIEFRVKVSSGTYIRSLGEELARQLGTCGHLVELTRNSIGQTYQLAQAISELPETCEGLTLISINDMLAHYPAISLPNTQRVMIQNGNSVYASERPGLYRILSSDGDFIGIGEINGGILSAKRMISI